MDDFTGVSPATLELTSPETIQLHPQAGRAPVFHWYTIGAITACAQPPCGALRVIARKDSKHRGDAHEVVKGGWSSITNNWHDLTSPQRVLLRPLLDQERLGAAPPAPTLGGRLPMAERWHAQPMPRTPNDDRCFVAEHECAIRHNC